MNCDYVLLFTPRVENDPNLYQQKKHFSGEFQDAFHEEYVLTKYLGTVIFEMGLFASSVRALCIEKNIDANFIGAFENDLKLRCGVCRQRIFPSLCGPVRAICGFFKFFKNIKIK